MIPTHLTKLTHPTDVYYVHANNVFNTKPTTIPDDQAASVNMHNVQEAISSKLMLHPDERIVLQEWARGIPTEKTRVLSAMDSMTSFQLSDHPLLQPLLDRLLAHMDLDPSFVQPEPYMQHYLHRLTGSSDPDQHMPHIHDVNMVCGRINLRFYVCLDKSNSHTTVCEGMPCLYNSTDGRYSDTHAMDLGCSCLLYPAEYWYTFTKLKSPDDFVTWLTLGCTISVDVYLKRGGPFHPRSLNDWNQNTQTHTHTHNHVTLTSLLWTDASEQQPVSTTPIDTELSSITLPDPICSGLQQMFLEKRSSYPALVVHYNTLVMHVPLDEIGNFPECIASHQAITDAFVKKWVLPTTTNVSLEASYLVHLNQGGYFEEAFVEDQVILFVLQNTSNCRLFTNGCFYPLKQGHVYYMPKRYGITLNRGDQPVILMKWVYTLA